MATDDKTLKRTLFHIPVGQIKELDALGVETQVSRAAHVRLAIDDYLRKQRRRRAS